MGNITLTTTTITATTTSGSSSSSKTKELGATNRLWSTFKISEENFPHVVSPRFAYVLCIETLYGIKEINTKEYLVITNYMP
jgi:hypothetical protein